MIDSKQNKDVRVRPIRWIVFLIFVLPLLVTIFKFSRHQTKLDNDLAAATSELDLANENLTRLNNLKNELESKSKISDFQRDRIAHAYSSYRDIDDFASNSSAFVVFAPGQLRHLSDTLNFSVPDGKHVFLLQWEKIDSVTNETLDEKKLEFPIQGPGGFQVALDLPQKKGAAYRDPRQLTLMIKSTSDDFKSVFKNLLEPFPTPSSSSTSGGYSVLTKPVAYPNQVKRDYGSTEQPTNEGLLLNKMRWGTRDQQGNLYRLAFEMRLKSEGPQTVGWPAYGVESKLTYAGAGMYIVDPEETPKD